MIPACESTKTRAQSHASDGAKHHDVGSGKVDTCVCTHTNKSTVIHMRRQHGAWAVLYAATKTTTTPMYTQTTTTPM